MKKGAHANEQPKILYGICGIGNGHTNRQLPLIEHFARKSRMMIFGYGESYAHFSTKFQSSDSIHVEEVAVPFYVGNHEGIDFEATANHPLNRSRDFHRVNTHALAKAQNFLGKPDLVITDYEPVSAQYAYTHNAPLVTIDQQSKYLCGDFPELKGHSCRDEIARLLMFFPQADARIACSFFQVPPKENPDADVLLYPPILKESIAELRGDTVRKMNSVLVYISSQQEFIQPQEEIVRICAAQRDATFHIFARGITQKTGEGENVQTYEHGDPHFERVFSECGGIVSTAGHTLLSEAMHAGIPVYTVPLPLYEQQMNAEVIDKHGFGVSHPRIDEDRLEDFVGRLPQFTKAIRDDKKVLLRGPSQQSIIQYLAQRFLS